MHLAGPAESFLRSLSRSDKETVDSLSTALRDRFSSKDRVLRMRQILSAREQGSHEPLNKYTEDLRNKLTILNYQRKKKFGSSLKVYALTPKRSTDAPTQNFPGDCKCCLPHAVQQSIQDAKGTYALSRIQQQLDAIVSGMATKEKPKESSVSAYQFSPPPSADDKLAPQTGPE